MSVHPEERPRVLIVDDQKNWLEALRDMLVPAYDIETATSYEDAMRQLRQRAFHVLVTDQRLVDKDDANFEGVLLLAEVAKFRDGTQAIIVTGYPTIDAAKTALRRYDAYDYLLKRPEEGGPFNIRDFRARVQGAIEAAIKARLKAITLDWSVSSLAVGLTYDLIAEALFPGDTTSRDAVECVRRAVVKLFYPFQPLAPEIGRAWTSQSDL